MTALILDGHPSPDSLTATLARRYAQAHGDAELVAVRHLDFDPILRGGYRAVQPLEPDLERALASLLAATHIVVATPVWWAGTPALLKGFFDRVLLPKQTYRYRPNGLPQGLLPARTGRLLLTSDSPTWFLRWTGDPAVRQVRNQTLKFCGVRRVRTTRFPSVRSSDDRTRARWITEVENLERRDAGAAVPARV
ncbi:NAD(P)H-dependent oxidoreductase [Microbacterium sp. NPDC086615]|uniref:NAD(P)H-dependent oxidoreductase n=1 Tax=Microbacterium sp. NPDC086615 TaxID=3154865 RepID=UPI0034459F4B